MAEKFKVIGPNTPIPTNSWRLGVFWFGPLVSRDYTDEEIKNYLGYSLAPGAGLDISVDSIEEMAIDLKVGGQSGRTFAAWVRNTLPGMTPVQFIRRANAPAVFSAEAAPFMKGIVLDQFLFKYFTKVVDATPVIWSTPESYLNTDSWYTGGATWIGSLPSRAQLEERLKSNGYNLLSVDDSVKTYYLNGQPRGLIFIFHTGQKATTVDAVRKAIGASSMVVNLEGALDQPEMNQLDRMYEIGDEFLSTAGDVGETVATGVNDAVKGASKSVGLLASAFKYLPAILVIGGISYVGYRGYRLIRGRRSYR